MTDNKGAKLRQLPPLILYGLRNAYRPKRRRRISTARQIFITISILALAALIAYGYYYFCFGVNRVIEIVHDNSQTGYVSFDLSATVFTIALLADVALILFFSVSFAFSTFFRSGDLEMLIAMPIKPQNIILSKLIVVTLGEYVFSFAFLVPFIASYGAVVNAGMLYWLFSAVILITLPIIPMCLGTTICLLLVRFLGKYVTVDRMNTLFQGFIYIVWIGLWILAQNGMNRLIEHPESILSFILNSRGQVATLTTVYPPLRFAIFSLTAFSIADRVINLAIFLSLTGLAAFGVWILARTIYLTAAMSFKKSTGKRKAMTGSAYNRSFRTASRFVALASSEMKIILKTPSFFINTYLIYFFIPVIFVFSAVNNNGIEAIQSLGYLPSESISLVLFVVLMFVIFLHSANQPTTSTFSREGASHWLSCVLPLSPLDQLLSRCLYPFFFNTAVSSLIIFMLISAMRPAFPTAVVTAINAITCLWPFMLFGLVFDAMSPKLTWENPMRAVKNNLNSFKVMLMSIAYITGVSILYNMTKDFMLTMILCAALNIALTAGLSVLFLKNIVRWLQRSQAE